jgi:hypothetical protein
MTISDTSQLWGWIAVQVCSLLEFHHLEANAALALSDLSDPWNRYEYLRRESILSARMYQGDVFQPLFFSLLCDKFKLWGQTWNGPRRPHLMQEVETKSN